MSGHHFRDYHLLLDEQADQLFAMTDPVAERVRKLGGLTLRSIGQIFRTQRVLGNDADYVEPLDMLAELEDDNKELAARLREAHNVCDEHRDARGSSSRRRAGPIDSINWHSAQGRSAVSRANAIIAPESSATMTVTKITSPRSALTLPRSMSRFTT